MKRTVDTLMTHLHWKHDSAVAKAAFYDSDAVEEFMDEATLLSDMDNSIQVNMYYAISRQVKEAVPE